MVSLAETESVRQLKGSRHHHPDRISTAVH
jgi:hypothetical protein